MERLKRKNVRILGDGSRGFSVYHAQTWVAKDESLLGPEEKEAFRTLMGEQEQFSGCRVLAYCLMRNRVEVILEVPQRNPEDEAGELDDEKLLKLLGIYHDRVRIVQVRKELRDARTLLKGSKKEQEEGQKRLVAIHKRHQAYRYSLTGFFRSLLQRFASWYNRKHQRKGKFWGLNFESRVIEGPVELLRVTNLIEELPVREGLVEEPGDYRWSSLGEAVRLGSKRGKIQGPKGALVKVLKKMGSES